MLVPRILLLSDFEKNCLFIYWSSRDRIFRPISNLVQTLMSAIALTSAMAKVIQFGQLFPENILFWGLNYVFPIHFLLFILEYCYAWLDIVLQKFLSNL